MGGIGILFILESPPILMLTGGLNRDLPDFGIGGIAGLYPANPAIPPQS